MRIGQPEKTHDHVKWNDDHDRREHVGEEDQPCDRLPPIAFSASSLMQNGVSMWRAAGFLGMSVETLDRVNGHHHPDYLSDAAEAIGRKPNRNQALVVPLVGDAGGRKNAR